MNSVNVALICPFSTGPARGNITTVRRIAEHLPRTGCLATMLSLDTMGPLEQRSALDRVCPDLLHAFHAYHAGPATRSLARELGIPYLITITGSDLFDPVLRYDSSARLALADAVAVTCFDSLVARHLAQNFPEISGRIRIVQQGVAPFILKETFPHDEGEFIILLPAAIRPVKGIINAIEALTPLATTFPTLRLLLAGGDIDPIYATNIREKVASLPWIHMLGEVPHQRMGAIFATSDLVLNCSLFEGGMANSLLEAMIMGKPVLARDVLGNRSLIRHGNTGWLYKSDNEFREFARSILENPGLGVETGKNGKNFVQKHCSILTEVKSYRELYERILDIYSSNLTITLENP